MADDYQYQRGHAAGMDRGMKEKFAEQEEKIATLRLEKGMEWAAFHSLVCEMRALKLCCEDDLQELISIARPEGVSPYVDEIASLRAEREAKDRCLSFFRSAIKSGEPWTETCEKEWKAARIEGEEG